MKILKRKSKKADGKLWKICEKKLFRIKGNSRKPKEDLSLRKTGKILRKIIENCCKIIFEKILRNF